jgi:hypothetical protein
MVEKMESLLRQGNDMLTRARDQLKRAPSRTGWDYIHTQVAKASMVFIDLEIVWQELKLPKKGK